MPNIPGDSGFGLTVGATSLDHLLQEADHLLLGLFGNALIGVYVIQDNRFIYVNPRLANLFGYSQQELCSCMGPMHLTAPNDQPTAQNEIDRRISGGSAASFYSFRGVRKDGSQFDAEVFGVATVFDGRPAIIGMLLDVTERTTAERAVADHLHFIERLIETIPNPVFYKDEQGIYLGCNAAFEEYIGIERDKLVGRSVYDISPPDLAEKYFAADQALFDNPGKQVYEAAVSYADGSRRDVVFYKATFDKADGNLGGLVGVILDISERKRMEEAIWHEANYDALTALPNRRLLLDRLAEDIKRAQRDGGKLALLFIDLDRFKEVNDTLGHRLGDQLLIEAAERICASVRASDTVARLGGDEFITILPDIEDGAVVGNIAQGIIRHLAQPFELDANLVYVSASIGITLFPDDGGDIETLLSHSDQAMYAAKAMGRNCFCYFTQSMQTDALHRLELANDLRKALAQNQFVLHYQPIVDLATGLITKAEALIRWRHPTRGHVSPVQFIPLAEEIGLIGEIGEWVFQQALATAEACRTFAAAGRPIQIGINISPQQIVAGQCAGWLDQIREQGLSPEALTVEITEGLLLDERPVVAKTLLAFRDAGMPISIDDFGTGYSAMSYLKRFDIDYLKIDRSFVCDLATDPSDHAICEAVIVMAHKLGIKVVAEGVETEEQRELLRQAGCDYAQGYLFAKPMPGDEFLHLLAHGGGD